jgi:hypothetical protein
VLGFGVTEERANEILSMWGLVAYAHDEPTPRLVMLYTGATWYEWTLAHKIVYAGLDPGEIDIGFA